MQACPVCADKESGQPSLQMCYPLTPERRLPCGIEHALAHVIGCSPVVAEHRRSSISPSCSPPPPATVPALTPKPAPTSLNDSFVRAEGYANFFPSTSCRLTPSRCGCQGGFRNAATVGSATDLTSVGYPPPDADTPDARFRVCPG